MNDERGSSRFDTPGETGAIHELANDTTSGTSDVAPAFAAPAMDQAPLTHREKRLIVICMMLPVFLGSVDQSILASALPTIGRSLGEVHNLPWLITAYLIASTALTPLYGKFADIHGRRAAMLIGVVVYMIGSFISAASPNMLMLICGRVVQGCGAGGLTVTANMVLGDIAAPKDRGKYYMYFSIAFTSAGATGPALGGWISEHLSWPVIFLWNFPLCALALGIALTVLRRLPRRERPHRLDVAGAVLVMAASSTFMLALNLGGVRYPWLSSPVLALLGGALVLGAGFILRLRTAAEPLIPIGVLSDPAARLTIAAHSFGWGAIVSLTIFLPMYLQSALGWVADIGGAEPDDPDGDAQYQRGIDQSASRSRAALQAPAVVLSLRQYRRRRRAGVFGRQHGASQIRYHSPPDRRGLGPDRAVDASGAAKHRSAARSRRGARHHEFRAHAHCHDPHCDIRSDRVGAGARRCGRRYAEPELSWRRIDRDLRNGLPGRCRDARRGVPGGDLA
jgi:MFS family permease